jgi:putative holliday junction resolvase
LTFPPGDIGTGRVVGIDLGSVRIGVAISDREQMLATGLTILARSGDVDADHSAVADIVTAEDAVGLIVGVPTSLDGTQGPAARAVLEEVDALRTVVPVPVETCDERLTTVAATRALRTGIRGRRDRRGRRVRSLVDQVAASMILQTWLDRRRGPAGPGGHERGPAGPGGHERGPAGPGGHERGPEPGQDGRP